MKNVSKSFLVVGLVFLLTACGGGGGSSSPNSGSGSGGAQPSLPMTVSLSGLPAEIDEGKDYTLTVTVTNARNTPQIKFTSTSSEFTVSQVDPQTFTLRTPDVDRNIRATIQMQVTDGQDPTRMVVTNVTTMVKNTSFLPELKVANYLHFDRDRFLTAKDETALLIVLRNLTQLAEPIAKGNAVWSKTGIPAPVALEAALNTLNNALQHYESGAVVNGETTNEVKVRAAIAQVNKDLEQFMVYYSDAINAELEVLDSLMPGNLKASHFIVDPEKQVSSFFIGNSDFGAYDSNGVWQYASSYQFMNNIVTNSCAQ